VDPTTVVFICSANLCRSPMAQAILAAEVARRKLPITVLSAGIWDFEGEAVVAEARQTCERHGTPMPKVVATHFSKLDLAAATRVFVMERRHAAALLAAGAVAPERVSLLGDFDPHRRGAEIEDPIGQDADAFERCYERLRDCILHYQGSSEDRR
jgi:protein-tyrosine-phosphatase